MRWLKLLLKALPKQSESRQLQTDSGIEGIPEDGCDGVSSERNRDLLWTSMNEIPIELWCDHKHRQGSSGPTCGYDWHQTNSASPCLTIELQ